MVVAEVVFPLIVMSCCIEFTLGTNQHHGNHMKDKRNVEVTTPNHSEHDHHRGIELVIAEADHSSVTRVWLTDDTGHNSSSLGADTSGQRELFPSINQDSNEDEKSGTSETNGTDCDYTTYTGKLKRKCYGAAHGLSEEKELITQLLKRYDKQGAIGRPLKNDSASLTVNYGISLVQIMSLDERNQVLVTNVWTNYDWQDSLLTWEKEEYGNVSTIRIPPDRVWKPDIVLYNYADTRLGELRDALIIVSNTGSITWMPTALFKSNCEIDTRNFPFDEQQCLMKFAPWSYDGDQLDVQFWGEREYIELSDYVESQEWAVIEHPAKRHVSYFDCCTQPYPDLTFYLRIRRKAAFYNYVLILPCVLLSTTTMVLFTLPPESPAKIQLGISTFGAFFLLLLLLKDTTPPASKSIPLIGAFYCFSMIMTTVSTILCAFVVDYHFRADMRNLPPRLLKFVIIKVLGRALNLTLPPGIDSDLFKKKPPAPPPPRVIRASDINRVKTRITWSPSDDVTAAEPVRPASPPTAHPRSETSPPPEGPNNPEQQQQQQQQQQPQEQQSVRIGYSEYTISDLREISQSMKYFVARAQRRDDKIKEMSEWRTVAMVCDRLCFFGYVICLMGSFLLYLPEVPSNSPSHNDN